MTVDYKREARIFTYVLAFTIISIFIFRYSKVNLQNTGKKLLDGAVDLKSFDLRSTPFRLDGEWAFYYGATYYSRDFVAKPELKPFVTELKPWKDIGLKNTGIGTYRAVIKKDPLINDLGIKISSAFTSYKLYVNGNLVNGVGHLYSNEKNPKAYVTSDYHFFKSPGDQLEIIIQVSNSDFYLGGLCEPPILGTQRSIQTLKDVNITTSVFLVTSLLMISFFLFSFYLAKEEESCMIYLGIASICYILKILVSISGPMYFIYYSVSFEIMLKIFQIAGTLTIYFIFNYFYKSFGERDTKVTFVIQLLLQMYCVLCIFSRIEHYFYIYILGIILTAMVYIYAFIKAAVDLTKFKKEAVFNFGGALILLISFSLSVDDLKTSKYRIVGLFMFSILILVDIIKDYISTYNNLKLIKNNLETEVKNRTLELVNINKNLQKEIDARLRAEENLKTVSNYDLDTGVFTNTYAKNYLDDLMSVYYRHNHPFSIIVWEIDDLDNVKKTFGEEISEKVLKETIIAVKSMLRRTDILANWTKNSFIIIMPNCLMDNSVTAAEKVKSLIAENIIEGFGVITISMGIACVEENDNSGSIIKRAENNLLVAQSRGKNCYYSGN